MGKSKRGPALFDLLRDDSDHGVEALKVPVPAKRRVPADRSTPKTTATSGESLGTHAAPESVPLPISRGSGFLEVERDRIRVSLTSVTAAVVVFTGMAVLLAAFEVGRRVGNSSGFDRGLSTGRESFIAETDDEIEAARRQPPATDLIRGLLGVSVDEEPESEDDTPVEQPVGAAREAATQPVVRTEEPETASSPSRRDSRKRSKWIRDYTYIVAQEFPAGRNDDAERTRRFLADSGVLTEIVRYPSGSIQLITLQGYNRDDSTQRKMSDDLVSKVHRIGTRYFRQGGGYKLEGYHKALKDDNW